MRVRDVQQMIDEWAPPMVAWERDNTGLQCGEPGMPVRGILLCLDVTEGVVRDALRHRANLVVSHHPLLFHPLTSLTPATHIGRTILSLVRKGIAALAVHTNLDAAPGGTSHVLANVLGIHDAIALEQMPRLYVKLVTFVPPANVDRVAGAMAAAGAGAIGNYDECSFRTGGIGTFRGNTASSPAVGRREMSERVPEVRLEMLVERRRLAGVVAAMRGTHPYEEVAYDVLPLENPHPHFGMGAIGDLERPVALKSFLARIRRVLGTGALRFTGNPNAGVRRVAVCGGSGSALLPRAIAAGADLFVTADVAFHTFQDAAGRIALVDAGHHETEYPVLPALAGRLREVCRVTGERVPVAVSAVHTNPIAYV